MVRRERLNRRRGGGGSGLRGCGGGSRAGDLHDGVGPSRGALAILLGILGLPGLLHLGFSGLLRQLLPNLLLFVKWVFKMLHMLHVVAKADGWLARFCARPP